jgi:LmbE family N-acetylglucosaminyl deacetylase
MPFSRRDFVVGAMPFATLEAAEATRGSRLHVVVTGGHPGDPECGCAGTVARFTELGHRVTLLYLNRGQGYCEGADPGKCGEVRTTEAGKACQILKARPVFAGQYDGRAVVDRAQYEEFRRLLDAEKPDVIFTQWPVDHHRDHRAVSMLALDAWLESGKKAAFYFYEVAEDTMMFSPADFVDISGVETQRRAACYAHASQLPDKWYPKQVEITKFRGAASGFPQAEGFLRHWESRPAPLP